MALIDLNKELTRIVNLAPTVSKTTSKGPDVYADEAVEKLLTSHVLNLLTDSNAEVKNAAVACLANMSKKARPNYLRQIVVSITDGIGAPDQKVDEEVRDISCLALKSVVAEIPPEGANVDAVLAIILDRVRQNVAHPSTNPQLASELLQILTDVYQRFPAAVAGSADLQETSYSNFNHVLSTSRLSIRKRAVPALAAFIAISPQRFEQIKEDLAKGLAAGGDSAKAWVAAVGGIAKTSAAQAIGALIAEGGLLEAILKQTEDLEDSEAVEGALTTLEVLVLRTPATVAPYAENITNRALQLVKYDPNYVDFDDDDVDMDDEDNDDDDDDDEFDTEAYSDDDDDSWKIRRSSAKLLNALISTRIDLLLDFYKVAAPVLIARFSEREESVRLEVLSAFEALLKQTANARTAELSASGKNKRKRSDDMDQDASSEESVVRSLQDLRPQLVKAILKQTTAKTVSTRQQSFVLLRQVVEALDGGLDAEADAICTAAQNALRTSDSTTPSLTIAALTFLAAFFTHHLTRSYSSHLVGLSQSIVRCMRDKLQRVNFEAFAAASALAKAIRPLHNNRGSQSPLRSNLDQPIQQIFSATTSVLGDTSVDGDVREKALNTLGDLLVHEGDALSAQLPEALKLITARLASENTAPAAVVVIGRVAESALIGGAAFDAWLLEVLSEVVVFVRRNKRSVSKTAEFVTLGHILNRIGPKLPADVASAIVGELEGFVATPGALRIISLVLEHQPASRAAVEKSILPQVFQLILSPSSGPVTDELPPFFGTYVDGDVDCATRLVPTLVANLPKASIIPDATAGGTLPYNTTAKVIGTVVEHSQRNLAGILSLFQRPLKSSKSSEVDLYLALLVIGEVGRNFDLSTNAGLLESVLALFQHPSEDVRSAAAFAAGNITVGASDQYLPVLIKHIENEKSESIRLLLLYSLKEVILNSSTGQLEKLTDILWKPLFGTGAASPDTATTGDDGIRNVKAACIGKLTVASPERFLPQLQNMLQSTPAQRALVAASIRYTFIDSSASYSELLAPYVGDFLSLMQDENAVVRRLSVASLNAALQHQPHLIVDKLGTVQPWLYAETEVKKELQREVQMGPWKVIEDDGLENRKTAYETLYTLLATAFSKIDLPKFTSRVLAALDDVNEIKILGLMLLLRLGQLAPAVVIPRLDDVAASLVTIMKDLEVKEDTIKQDLERKREFKPMDGGHAQILTPRRGDAANGASHRHPPVPHEHRGTGSPVPFIHWGTVED
ncbi:hypothetical protein VHUM_03824 [Vanrija humicola]|uniref:TATA-binding protein interacting (TIP20) domain-containing protein n=1 Tax=Vanrija humicola TaxID=5417 RepID=A0A7D8Z089_VANHU|nr:hypothetical protein VHUM_03824 [Vanrija humicola]